MIVQQLNFYSFRKVKYHDSLRIDPEIEKETANYWRFKHENFQRGKPHLLSLIKRTQSATKEGGGMSASASVTGSSSSPQPEIAKSSNQINNDTATEVQHLKMRIEEMTKNIDELTAMVKEVSLKQEDGDDYSGASVGYKRKKFSVEAEAAALGNACMDGPDEIRPDDMLSSMELDEMIALPVSSMPSAPVPDGIVRETSTSTQSSDFAFVDTFFTSFKDEPANDFDDVFIQDADVPPHFSHLPNPSTNTARESKEPSSSNDRPDPELMKRLGDALMLLPRETQEIIVNRLIAAITSADFMSNMSSSSSKEGTHQKSSEDKAIVEDVVADAPQTSEEQEKAPYPLAAATLAALLKHYSSQLQRGESSASTNKNGPVAKSIPVIPVHA